MLEASHQLFNQWKEHNVQYCHWKSNEHLYEALCGDTDLDILFDLNQKLELQKVFSECGIKFFRATP